MQRATIAMRDATIILNTPGLLHKKSASYWLVWLLNLTWQMIRIPLLDILLSQAKSFVMLQGNKLSLKQAYKHFLEHKH